MLIIKDKVNKTITYDYGVIVTYKKVVHGCYSAEADATEEEFEDAIKKAESCMKLTIHEMIRQDKTMREMYHNKCQ